jgi:hypothetical protein
MLSTLSTTASFTIETKQVLNTLKNFKRLKKQARKKIAL